MLDTNQLQLLDTKSACAILVGAQGNLALATARAQKQLNNPSITESFILSVITADPTSPAILFRQIQLLMVLQTFDVFRKTQTVFLEKLPNMSPHTVAQTYTKMVDSLSTMTKAADKPAASSPDALQAVLTALPPEIADAVEALMNAQNNPENHIPLLEALASETGSCEGSEDEDEAKAPADGLVT